MKQIKKQILFAILSLLLMTGTTIKAAEASYEIIPLPNQVTATKGGTFNLNAATTIIYPKGNELLKKNAEFLSDYLKEITGMKLKVANSGSKTNAIVLSKELKNTNNEAYKLTVTAKTITITGASEAGVFYGIQTLRKATPVGATTISYPAVIINDAPRFAYRGMHLDVARHFVSADFVKKYIDILAMHNVNKFHWHLTEDQGWRIEIKKYPRLTEIGSIRKETVIGHNTGKFDGKPHGGFYTQEQIKDIVAYAQARYITIIPEIDLPGHMLAALAAYPELGCTGGPYEVERTWGVFDDVLCAGKENTYTFLENVLTEVMALFPSKYIHIGGDESPKVRWAKCPHCQAKIKELGLKDTDKHKKEFYLQSYVTERIEKFLNKNGRSIIGWDEILEGELAPNATVMSWRGIDGGIEAAKMGHDVIMTPNDYLYFDYYQTSDTENEPMAIGGFVPLERVYNYEPLPASLTPEQKKHILGPQANIWTEYIPNSQQVEYMLLPRLAALCEVQWTQPEKKNYANFVQRLTKLIKLYDLYNLNYATHVFDIQAKLTPNPQKGTLDATLNTIDKAPVYYTLDGTEPTTQSTLYKGVLNLGQSGILKAKAFRENGKNSRTFTEKLTLSKSSLKPITLLTKPARNYEYTGAPLLNDGLTGKGTNYKTGKWIGFAGNNLEAVIDLQKPTEISQATIHCCVVTGDWILDAEEFTMEVSDDGKNFTPLAGLKTNPTDRTEHWKGVVTHTVVFKPLQTRYVKVTVKPFSNFPQWHGADGKPYLFVDEISID